MYHKMMMDIASIYFEGRSLFPYWDDELLEKWKINYGAVLNKINEQTTLTEFYCNIKKWVATLDDGHTLVYLPEEIKQQGKSLPIELTLIEGELVICSALPEYKNLTFLPIKRIYNLTTEDFINEVSAHFWKSNLNVSLTNFQNHPSFLFPDDSFWIEFKDGTTKKVNLLEQPVNFDAALVSPILMNHKNLSVSEAIDIYIIENKALIKIKNFMTPEVVTEFYRTMPLLEQVDEVLFDIRKNFGGNSGFANEIAQAFFDGPMKTEKSEVQNFNAQVYASATQLFFNRLEINKDTQIFYDALQYQTLITEQEDDFYPDRAGLLSDTPVKIIMDDQTYSSSENFVMIFDNVQRATLIGSTTAGSTGQPALIKLETGGVFMVTAKKVAYPNGTEHHNIGIKPDIEMLRKIVVQNNDVILTNLLLK